MLSPTISRVFLFINNKFAIMKALKGIPIENIIFLDIETVRLVDKLENGTPLHASWDYKMRHSGELAKNPDKTIEQLFEETAALHAEFAKPVCVTIGKIKGSKLMLKSYAGTDEVTLLKDVANVFNSLQANNRATILCGHAALGFDLPFLMRRMLVHGIDIPNLIDFYGCKPWDLTVLDTLNIWKGTGFHSASLISIAVALGIASPKDVMEGQDVGKAYWQNNDIDAIVSYCSKDVHTVANVLLKMRNEPLVNLAESSLKEEKPVGILQEAYNTKKLSKSAEKKLLENMEALDPKDKKKAQDLLNTAITK